MFIRLARLLSVVLLSGCGVSPTGPTLGLGSDSTKVIVLADVVGRDCNQVSIMLGRKTTEGFSSIRGVATKVGALIPSKDIGAANPMVMNFEPGDYHIVALTCIHGSMSTVIGRGDPGLFATTYKHSYASFSVPQVPLLDIGYLRFHVSGDRVERVEVLNLLPETRSALARNHPVEYASIVSRHMIVAPELSGESAIAQTQSMSPTVLPVYLPRR